MRHHVGCAVFTLIGLAWLGFFFFDLLTATLGDCVEDSACEFYRGYVSGMVMWRGIAVALLLILAYLAFRFFHEDEDVQ